MTGRERLVAAGRGGELDRKPLILRTQDAQADGWVSTDGAPSEGDQACLKLVNSPFARSLAQGLDLNDLMQGDPASGEQALSSFAADTRKEMLDALEAGFDGIYYRLDGAYPDAATPMEYGGHYLEVDRALLSEVADARFNLIWVEGDSEPYLDFVSDLPGHALGWSVKKTGVSVESLREMRSGAIAGDVAESDIHIFDTFAEAQAALSLAEARN